MAKPEDAAQTMINNLPDKTGKSLSQWHAVIKKAKLTTDSKHGEIMKLLKGEHGVSHGFANLITAKYREGDKASAFEASIDLVAAQYEKKESLKPIYDKLVTTIKKIGKDVELSPKKAYVSIRRSKQFAIIQPSTKTRLDVGIQLKGVPNTERLEASGSFNAMVSHRVRVSDSKEVDAELIAWLKQAYQSA